MDNVLPVMNSVRRVLVTGVDVDVVGVTSVDVLAAGSSALGGVGGVGTPDATIGRCGLLMVGKFSVSSASLVSAYFMLGLREIINKLELCINDDNDACKETCEH